MTALMNMLIVVSILNTLLLVPMLYTYGRATSKTRSSFAIGLLLFSVLLFLQNAVSAYYFITMMPLFVTGLEPYVLSFNALQLLALIVLNWVTWR